MWSSEVRVWIRVGKRFWCYRLFSRVEGLWEFKIVFYGF